MCEVVKSFRSLVVEVATRMEKCGVVREFLEKKGMDVDAEVRVGKDWIRRISE